MVDGNNDDLVTCSFCGKDATEVGKLIAGPGVYICDGCIQLCNDIIDGEAAVDAEESEVPDSGERLRWRGASSALDEGLGRRPTVGEVATELGWMEQRVVAVARGAQVRTAGAARSADVPTDMVEALGEVQRQLARLARRVAALTKQARQAAGRE